MSESVDLNYKVWGFKAKNHLYAFFIADLFVSLLALLALIDYMNLPEKPPAGVKSMIFNFIVPLIFTLCIFGCIMSIVFCCSNRIFYGIYSVLLLITSPCNLIWNILILFVAIGDESSKTLKLQKKYYKIGLSVAYFSWIVGPILRIYLGVVLFKLSFLYPTQRVVVVVAQPAPKTKKGASEGGSGPGKTGDSGNKTGDKTGDGSEAEE